MTARKTLTGVALVLALILVPPIPGWLFGHLADAPGWLDRDQPTWRTMLDPLRFAGALLALCWTWTIAQLPAATRPHLLYPAVFVLGGAFYAIPAWLGVLGADPGWQAVLWLASIATVSEWSTLNAPLAGLLCLGACCLMRGAREPEPVSWTRRVLRRIGVKSGGWGSFR